MTVTEVKAPVASLERVSKHYRVRRPDGRHATLRAVDDLSLAIPAGTTVGLVGESGSGKSTVARLMLRLVDPTSGRVFQDGTDITSMRGRALRETRARMQLVFQDPYSSFDPRSSIDDSIAEALRGTGLDKAAKIERSGELLETVGLAAALGGRRPRELSGGQLQRAAIARALAVDPALIALDEPVSSLDVSSQVHIIELLQTLQRDLGVAMLFISHDLSVVRDVSHEIAVMYVGKLVGHGPASEIYDNPQHPYSEALLSAVPRMSTDRSARRERVILHGDLPSPLDPPNGCRFHTRCPVAIEVCRTEIPQLAPAPGGTGVEIACHLRTEGGAMSLPLPPTPTGTESAPSSQETQP